MTWKCMNFCFSLSVAASDLKKKRDICPTFSPSWSWWPICPGDICTYQQFWPNFWDPIFRGLNFSGQFFLVKKFHLTRALNFHSLKFAKVTTYAHSYDSQLLFTALDQIFDPKFLWKLLFTSFFTTVDNKFCSQLLFITFVHNFCSQLLLKFWVQNLCSQFLFITLVQSFYWQLWFITVLRIWLKVMLKTVVWFSPL